MPDGFSIIKINGKLSEPSTVLIQKISDAVGGLYKPYQIKRVAKAEAEAEVIEAKAQIEITDLNRRALTRFITEEAKKQNNMESITEKAIPLLNNTSNPQKIEDDWITNFFDKCCIISDEHMQLLWAKVLAGEANSPGIYSRRTVNTLASIDKFDAQLFTNLCSFLFFIKGFIPLIYDVNEPIYTEHEINFGYLTHLDDIGLISFNVINGFNKTDLPPFTDISYYGAIFRLSFKNPLKRNLNVGKAIFTNVGSQLATICDSKPVTGFPDYVIKILKKEGVNAFLLKPTEP